MQSLDQEKEDINGGEVDFEIYIYTVTQIKEPKMKTFDPYKQTNSELYFS